ncbi:hypothetical protein BC332_07812 [Capsicum chinense]|nr:hypothetical protein BC332_07812 [Capsicum chinense]
MTSESQMQDMAMTVGVTSIASTNRANAPQPMTPAEKPRKFAGIDFKRWKQKMFFYLTTLCLQKFTSEDAPEVPEGTSDKKHFIIVKAWKHLDFLCRNCILSGLQDDLYNVYSRTKAPKELWGSKDHVSDPLTKGLSREGVERTSKGMGLRPRTNQHGAFGILGQVIATGSE